MSPLADSCMASSAWKEGNRSGRWAGLAQPFFLPPPQELSAFPKEPGGSGAGLHPVVYPCTALLLLCLLSTIITYILNRR